MEIHVLYDNRPQPDRLPFVMDELERQALFLHKVWEPIPAKTVVESINLSFKQIIRHAKERGLSEICIIEDDIMFADKGAWTYLIANKPKEYDLLIGGNYLINEPENYVSPYNKVNEYVGNQLIVVHKQYYDRFISVPDLAHIDTAQKGLGDFYACWPMVALQRPGFSANAGQKVNYNANLKPEWIYNGAVHNL